MSLNQKLLKEKLDEWAKLQAKIARLNKQKNNRLEPFIRKHHEETKPILDSYDEKISPLTGKASALAQEIEKLLLTNVDKSGDPKLITFKSEAASVQVSKSEGNRVVSVQKFFAAVKDKNEAFWNCLNVVIKHAEKLIGKDKVDEISQKKTSFSVSIEVNK